MIDDAGRVERALLEAAKAARATVLQSVFHSFKPRGVSGVVVVAESHLAIHTWPEHGLASVDIFTSGRRALPALAVPVLERAFAARETEVRELARGILAGGDD